MKLAYAPRKGIPHGASSAKNFTIDRRFTPAIGGTGMKSRNAQRCILGAVVVTLLFMEAWNTTAARSSATTICEAVRVDPTAAFALANPTSGGAIVLDATSNVRLEALPDPTLTAGAASPFAPPAASLDQVRNGSAASPVSPANWVNGN